MSEILNLFSKDYGDKDYNLFVCQRCHETIRIHNQTDEKFELDILRDHILVSHVLVALKLNFPKQLRR